MGENSCLIFGFNEKHCFMVLTEKLIISVLSEQTNFVLAKKLCFVRKIRCVVLPKKTWLCGFAEIFYFFCNFGRKQIFLFQRKNYFAVWEENKIYGFCGKNLFFFTICKNSFLRFCRENSFFRKFVFRFSWENKILWFWRKILLCNLVKKKKIEFMVWWKKFFKTILVKKNHLYGFGDKKNTQSDLSKNSTFKTVESTTSA